MSEHGHDFLRTWIERNVTDSDRNGSPIQAMTLAEKCMADAATAGIPAIDLEPTWGSVESIIYEAMRNDIGTMEELWNAFTRARFKDALS